MDRKVIKRSPSRVLPRLLRVAAYARVSTAKDAMHHSLSAQISYFSGLIQANPGWQYVGVYADEAKTGTRDERPQFQRLLADCKAGKVDMVITKSISRFARNTVTLLQTVRELKELGIDVFFEEQNIHSISADGEMMLTLLASFAQEESLSVSENQKWRVRRNFEQGKPWNTTMLGYRYKDGQLIIEPAEAEIVKRIFREYLSGKGQETIARELNEQGILSRNGNAWCVSSVSRVLNNYAYSGNLLLQKTYRDDHLTKQKKFNNGQLPMYHAEGTHDPIISLSAYEEAQAEMQRRAEKYTHPSVLPKTYPFTGKIVCGICGKHYRRKITATGPVWICSTYNSKGKSACPSKQIPERVLEQETAELDLNKVTSIRAENGNTLVFTFARGTESTIRWQDRSRAESWTTEMREQARQYRMKRRNSNG